MKNEIYIEVKDCQTLGLASDFYTTKEIAEQLCRWESHNANAKEYSLYRKGIKTAILFFTEDVELTENILNELDILNNAERKCNQEFDEENIFCKDCKYKEDCQKGF